MSGYTPDKAAAQEPDTEPGWTEKCQVPRARLHHLVKVVDGAGKWGCVRACV